MNFRLILSLFLLSVLFGCFNFNNDKEWQQLNKTNSAPSMTPPLPPPLPVEPKTTASTTSISACNFPASNLSYQIPAQKVGNRNLLVIIADMHSETNPTPSISDVRRIFFGQSPSVSDYYFNNSGGRMRLLDAGVYSYSIDEPIDTYFQNDPNDLDGDGWTGDVKKLWTEMIRKADQEVDFSTYDSNRDGYIYPEELGIFIVVPHSTPTPGGATRNLESRQYPYSTPLILDGVTLVSGASSGSGKPLNIGTPSHELLHLYLGTADLYFSYFFPYAAGAYSIMDQFWFAPHLDPYQKMRAGWLNLKQITSSGCYKIERIDHSNSVNVIEKRVVDGSEFYIFENRQRGTYDSSIPDSGLGIWRVIEVSGRGPSIQKPNLVRDEDWTSIDANDWGRRKLWMYRPSYYPFDDSKALWSNEDLQNNTVTFNWSDGTAAFELISVSQSLDIMEYRIKIR